MPRRTERMEFIANMLWNSDEKFGDLIGRTVVFWLFLTLFFALSSPWRWFFAAWCIWFVLNPLVALLIHSIVFIVHVWDIFTEN